MSERRALLNLGYTVLRKADGITYKKTYQSDKLRFDIELDPSLISSGQLPKAKLVGFPEELLGQAVPHVSGDRFCYVDAETLSWNPLDLVETF
ncbi:hypothetical protein, partial [Vibrio anguillarum]